MVAHESVPVVIVGAGPIGLCASILLSQRGIRHVVFERHPGTSIHPKACGINQRTTEIFRAMGIYEEVRRVAAPDDIKGRTGWFTSLGGQGNGIDGREVWSRDAWGGGIYSTEYETYSPARYEILPQIRLEPILVRRAMELAATPDTLRFGAEVLGLDDRGDAGVVVKVSEQGEEREVLARYVIAADGGRSITDKLGVAWLGERDIMDMVSVHFRASIRQHHPDNRNFITWFIHPERGGSTRTGYLYQIGPWPLDSPEAQGNEEWVFACAPTASDPEKFDNEAMIARLRDTLKIPDLQVEVISLSHWHVHAISAERYRSGRVFLVGDAAHRIPPWGALGMNSGIQDVQNLVWKIQFALRGDANGSPNKYDKLLDSYDIERRPIGRRVGLSSLHNLRSHGLIMDAALGVSPTNTAETNLAAIQAFWDESHPEHKAKLEAVHKASQTLDLEFKAPGAELGWFYPSADTHQEGKASRHQGQLDEDGELRMDVFSPSTIPGHNLPHVWISKHGQTIALRDLLLLDKLLLIGNGPAWSQLEDETVHVELVAPGQWIDESGRWQEYLDGYDAVLVRPDGIVAWRGRWHDSTIEECRTAACHCLGL
ncbi:uncharacterized protein E0L32_002826 [Thyridium curvatum]|uniref:FAD-binding domain-containing protein n=1 Tax=Thyridium curvatum TaxID=1093900 RepID=A0A507B3P1_9PEZI|nr:uncharacterized protein E0L32_002826 [Thyridium curvatum]TPX17725.1 hypothetical protein E0L32_002826 [Thyridium curvatum]